MKLTPIACPLRVAAPPLKGLTAAAPSLPAQAWTARRSSASGTAAACKAHQRPGLAERRPYAVGQRSEPEADLRYARPEALRFGLPAGSTVALTNSVIIFARRGSWTARLARHAALLTGLALPLPGLAQSVALAGLMGQRALLVVDGQAPKSVTPGESHLGVKLVSVGEGQAVVEIRDKRHSLRLGEAPLSVGSSRDEGKASRIVLTAGTGGHFIVEGQVNGKSARLMVDTGASLVALSAAEADHLGLIYKNGQRAGLSTANGVVMGWILKLDSVRIGDVTVRGVDAVVTPQAMPYILLGNSFLGRFQMNRENDQLTLSRRF